MPSTVREIEKVLKTALNYLISGFVDEITLTGCCNELLMKTGYNAKWRPFIGPTTASLSVTSQWWQLNSETSLPSIICFLDCGVVRIRLGQEHVLCFQQIADHIHHFIQVSHCINMILKFCLRKCSYYETG